MQLLIFQHCKYLSYRTLWQWHYIFTRTHINQIVPKRQIQQFTLPQLLLILHSLTHTLYFIRVFLCLLIQPSIIVCFIIHNPSRWFSKHMWQRTHSTLACRTNIYKVTKLICSFQKHLFPPIYSFFKVKIMRKHHRFY